MTGAAEPQDGRVGMGACSSKVKVRFIFRDAETGQEFGALTNRAHSLAPLHGAAARRTKFGTVDAES